MNKGEALSGEKMSALYFDLLKRYHGPKVTIEPVYGAEWMYIHILLWLLRLAICNLDHRRELLCPEGDEGTPADRDRYLAVLRSGGSDYGYTSSKWAVSIWRRPTLSPYHRQL